MDYEDMYRPLLMVYTAKLMVDYGKKAEFQRRLSGYILDNNSYYDALWEALPYACNETFHKYYENSQVERFWFFDEAMIDFYKLCLVYNERYGIALNKDPNLNPYYKAATAFVREQLDFGAYTCDCTLYTDVTRKGRCRIVFVYDCYFDGLFHLLRGVYTVFGYYRQKAKELRKLLYENKKQRKGRLRNGQPQRVGSAD
jgi:ferredoxin-thioredoxin reductase catalytic subunit